MTPFTRRWLVDNKSPSGSRPRTERVQANALKLQDPQQAKSMTRAEREEVFNRSIKAAGLDKEPLTPAQKALVEKMLK